MEQDALKREYEEAVAAMAALVADIQAAGRITEEMYPRLIETRLRWWTARERYRGVKVGGRR